MSQPTTASFVRDLRRRGCRVEMRDGRLHVGPRRLLTTQDHERLTRERSRIRRLLRQRRARREQQQVLEQAPQIPRQIVGQVRRHGRWELLYADECDPAYRANAEWALRHGAVRVGGGYD